MDTATWVLTGAVAALAVVVLALAVVVVRLGRAVERLHADPPARAAAMPPTSAPVEPEFVITSVGRETEDAPRVVPDRLVLSATLGEPLVKVVAFGHGVARALSPASRNRIGFEVRQEVKRSRKERRREMREAWRQMKADRARESTRTVPEAGRDVA